MPDDLSVQFNARLPLLRHVADALRDGIAEFIADASLSSNVRVDLLSVEQFCHLASVSDANVQNPLAEFSNQITGRVSCADANEIETVNGILSKRLTILNHKSHRVEGQPSELHLTCLIPPQAQPPGWKVRTDVPNQFELVLQSTGKRNQTTDPANTTIELHDIERDQPLALVMKGGGVKGLAYVGAIRELNQRYTFDWYLGTSAGAIAAVLLGAGFEIDEIESILKTKDFTDFFDASFWGVPLNLLFHRGCYKADALTDWLDQLLSSKLKKSTRVRLSDLPKRVTVFASRKNMVALRFDSKDKDADAAHAVRCSMSIPFVFVPQQDQGFRTFDGGLQHNYPVDQLRRIDPTKKFISLYLGPETYEPPKRKWITWDILSIWTEQGEAEALTEYHDRTVIIDPRPIGTLDFAMSQVEKQYLLSCGKAAALAHLEPQSAQWTQACESRDGLRTQVVPLCSARQTRRKRKWVGAAFLAAALVVVGIWLVARMAMSIWNLW